MSKLDLSLGIFGEQRENSVPELPVPKDKKVMIRWIQSRNYDEYTKQELLKQLKDIPDAAVGSFYKSIGQRVKEIRKNS